MPSYNTLIIDGKTQQVFLLNFLNRDRGFYAVSSLNGDFTTDPIHINCPFFTGTDFEVGGTPSSTLSFTLQNDGMPFSGFAFGEAQAYIGVLFDDTAVAGAGQTSTLSDGNTVKFRDANFGNDMSIGVTQIPDTQDTCFAIADMTEGADGYIYFVDSYDHLRKVNLGNFSDDTDLGSASEFFLQQNRKASNGNYKLISFDYAQIVEAGNYEYTVYYNGHVKTYDCDQIGTYNVTKPTSTSTKTIDVSDAFDRMRYLDVSCGTFVSDLWSMYGQKSCTAEQFRAYLETCIGNTISYQNNPVALTSINLPLYMLSDTYYSYRELLGFLAGALGGIARCTSSGAFIIDILPTTSTTPIATIPLTQIAANGYERADYYAHEVGYVELQRTDGGYFLSGVLNPGGVVYQLVGNPLLDEDGMQDADLLTVIGNYSHYHEDHPITVALTELNPAFCFKLSDVFVEKMYDPGNYDSMTIWETDLYWCGKTYGSIRNGGSEYRDRLTSDDVNSANAYSAGAQVNTAKRDNVILLATTTNATPTEYDMTVNPFALKNYSCFLLVLSNNGRVLVSSNIPLDMIGDPSTAGYNDSLPSWWDKAHQAAHRTGNSAGVKFDLPNWKCKLIAESPVGETWEARLYGIR